MTTVGLVLDPLDTLFFRSGRPFGAGLRGASELPTPQDFAGALRSFLLERAGADFEAMRGKESLAGALTAAGAGWLATARFRGPWLAEVQNREVRKPLFPAPADIVTQAGKPLLMRPLVLDLPGWKPPEPGMKPL
jgi:CRISPR type III-B/RAMP module-associated protein Cmr3